MVRNVARHALWTMVFAALLLPAWSATAAPAGSPEDTLAQAFRAALKGSFSAYLQTVHPDERETDVQRRDLRRYEFARFKKSAARYLKDGDPLSFKIARKDDWKTEKRRFLSDRTQPDRMPVPVRFRQDGARWLITSNSL